MKKQRKMSRKRQAERRKRKVMLCGFILACVFVIFMIVSLILSSYVNKTPENKICKGIVIGEVDVSGMTKKQAKKALESKMDEYRKQKLTLIVGDNEAEVTLGELGLVIKEEEKVLNEALDYGKKGATVARYHQIKKAAKEPQVIVPEYIVQKEDAEATLKEKVLPLEARATDAAIERSNGAFVITDAKEGHTLNVKDSMKEIRTYLNKDWKYKADSVKMISTVEKPKVERKDLEVIQDKLGDFDTYCGSGQSRVTNIKKAAEYINGTVLMPGDEFSANEVMRSRTEANGYVPAGSYENGEVVDSYGGGVCQVSTTLYNAVLESELEVLERSAHSMIVGYVKPSRDAAIAEGIKDFRFRNNLENPVYIESYVADGNLYFNIYGKEYRDAGREVIYQSETTSTKEAGKKYVASDAALGSKKQVSTGHPCVNAQLWKIVKENGKEVSKKVINKSTYAASDTKIEVGVSSGNAKASQIVRDAIATQDGGKIDAAIARANELIAQERQQAEQPQKTEEEQGNTAQ